MNLINRFSLFAIVALLISACAGVPTQVVEAPLPEEGVEPPAEALLPQETPQQYIDLANQSATIGEREVQLSDRETEILRCLAEHPGEVVPRDRILERVWGYEAFPSPRTIDNFILRLRRVLEPDPRHPRYIHTIKDVGYRLTP